MLGIPILLVLSMVLAAFLWVFAVGLMMRRGDFDTVKLLKITIWAATGAACSLTVLRRLELGDITLAVSITASLFISLIFVTAAIGGVPGRRHNNGMAGIALASTVVQCFFLVLNPEGAASNIGVIIALTFLPGIILQVRSSGASQTELLTLAARVSATVVIGSVLLGFLVPSLAYGSGFSDERRFSLLSLPGRLSGFTPHPNFLSFTALICIALFLNLKLRSRLVVITTSIAALAMAESRVAMLTLAVMAGVVWVCRGKNQLIRAAFVVPLSVIVILLNAALESSSFGVDVATDGRYRVWRAILTAFMDDPLAGLGPLAFTAESGSPLLSSGLQHAHNQVLQGIAEGGLVGGCLTLALIVALVQIGFRHRSEPVYPATSVIFLLSIFTEPFLTLHLYGFNYAIIPMFLIIIVLMSAPAGEQIGSGISTAGTRTNLQLYSRSKFAPRPYEQQPPIISS